MEYFLIYLMLQLDSILDVVNVALQIVVSITFIGSFALFMVSTFENENCFIKIPSKIYKTLGWSFALALLMKILLPTSVNMAIIVGGGQVYQAITSETGKRVGGKAAQLLEQKVDELLNQKVEEEKKESK